MSGLTDAHKKAILSELQDFGFSPKVIELALAKVPPKLKKDAAQQWICDWIFAHPQEKGAGGAAGGDGMSDEKETVRMVMEMGFSKADAVRALAANGDNVEGSIQQLIEEAEVRKEAEKKKQEEERKEEEAKMAETRKRLDQERKERRLKIFAIMLKTALAFKGEKHSADRGKDVRDADEILTAIYEQIEEDHKARLKAQKEAELQQRIAAQQAALDARRGAGRGRGGRGAPSPAAAAPAAAAYYDDETKVHKVSNCQHDSQCSGCFAQYLKVKIRDKDVTPWLVCPEPDCKVPLHPRDIIGSVTLDERFALANLWFAKILAREERWVECKTKGCSYGFWFDDKKVEKAKKPAAAGGFGSVFSRKAEKEKEAPEQYTDTCAVCSKQQQVQKKKEELDDEFQKMIKEGKLRECPKCKLLTMKEFGVCNVIECGKCGIWWNWRTRQTGKDSRELKDQARMNGSLWENGELAYQQKLERDNPEEFKKLLERNGVKWNPNYVRGT